MGEGFLGSKSTPPPNHFTITFKQRKKSGSFQLSAFWDFPFCCPIFHSNIWGIVWFVNWSKFPSSEDTRPAADEWKHQFQFIFQYQWISTRSMALVSMFLCNQSYASHGRDFLLGATILNFNAPFLAAHARMFKQPKPLWSIVNEHRFIFSSSSYIGSQVCSSSWSPFQLSSVRFLLSQK